MKAVLVGVSLLLVVVVAVLGAMAAGFSRRVDRAETRLAGYASAPVRDDLPARVRALGERGMAGGEPGGAVRLVQAAEMRLKPGADWTALEARQVIAAPVPGFAWVAALRLGPVPLVRVIDAYVDGDGRLEVRGLGALPMGTAAGPEATLGEALRYLAELPWAPDAILTNRAIAWRETAGGVVARLDTPGGPAEILFGLDDAGDIVTVHAEARPATLADGSPARLVWRGRFSDYGEIGGRRIPRAGEVGYDYPDGYESYWRGRITGYAVAPARP